MFSYFFSIFWQLSETDEVVYISKHIYMSLVTMKCFLPRMFPTLVSHKTYYSPIIWKSLEGTGLWLAYKTLLCPSIRVQGRKVFNFYKTILLNQTSTYLQPIQPSIDSTQAKISLIKTWMKLMLNKPNNPYVSSTYTNSLEFTSNNHFF